jgi:hypothetical protein
MTTQELLKQIRNLPAHMPITAALEGSLSERNMWNSGKAWYRSQKEHWIGWLSQYDGPGYYGRKGGNRSAEFVYNHVNCPPMVLWLGEAAGVSRKRVLDAKKAALSAKPNFPAQSAAIRSAIPWVEITARLGQ